MANAPDTPAAPAPTLWNSLVKPAVVLVHVPPEADEARDKPKAHGEDHLAFERGGRGRVVGRHEYGAQQQSA